MNERKQVSRLPRHHNKFAKYHRCVAYLLCYCFVLRLRYANLEQAGCWGRFRFGTESGCIRQFRRDLIVSDYSSPFRDPFKNDMRRRGFGVKEESLLRAVPKARQGRETVV